MQGERRRCSCTSLDFLDGRACCGLRIYTGGGVVHSYYRQARTPPRGCIDRLHMQI